MSVPCPLCGAEITIPAKPARLVAVNAVLRSVVSDIVNARMNEATAREKLRDELRRTGYAPAPGTEGLAEDLSSDARINLVVKTQTEMAQGAGHFVQQNAYVEVLEAAPALELYRLEERREKRDWPMRWRLCAQVVGDVQAARVLVQTGRMCALKSSRIWQALGDGEDGSTDTLGNPYPPFAFNSGMWTEELERQQAIDLGLMGENDRVQPAPFDWPNLPGKNVESPLRSDAVLPRLIPFEDERLTEYLRTRPETCDHCEADKPFGQLRYCKACQGLICPECLERGCGEG